MIARKTMVIGIALETALKWAEEISGQVRPDSQESH